MQAVRQVVHSNLLENIISLPRDFLNRNVEVIIFVKEEKRALPSLTKKDIDAMLKGSITESLIGALPYSDISVKDYREERLKKCECAVMTL